MHLAIKTLHIIHVLLIPFMKIGSMYSKYPLNYTIKQLRWLQISLLPYVEISLPNSISAQKEKKKKKILHEIQISELTIY